MNELYSAFSSILHILSVAKEPVTVILAVVAIVYAAIQKHESGKLLKWSDELKKEADDLEKNTKAHAEEMKGLTGEMREIAASMSTKYVGGFPKNMADITEVLTLADRRVDIQVDLVAYGHYSNPDGFKRYIDKIEELAKRSPQTTIRLLVYADETAQRGRAGQFGGPEGFPEEMKSERYRRYFRELYKGPPDPPATYEEFTEYLANRQREWCRLLDRYSAIEIRYASFPFRLFLWIEDQEEAVFAFEMYGRNRTISFRTRDGNLIHTFSAVFEQNWEECAPKPQEVERKPAQAITASKAS